MLEAGQRALGPLVWGRKAAVLPDRGTLIVATDLQGNLKDYQALKAVYWAEKEAGNDPILAFCGDLVHGPSPRLNEPGCWPDYLGTEYRDQSRELIIDFEGFTRAERSFSLLGNHEHAHIGGPLVSKFYPDEAEVLDRALGEHAGMIHELFRSLPLIAVAPCGITLTHGAPKATERDLEAFEKLSYSGYGGIPLFTIYAADTVGALLWARGASAQEARELLRATALSGRAGAFVAYGHDVVHHGYDRIGEEQICFSSSYGLLDEDKVYLRLDLSHRYSSVTELREGSEILKLYPGAGA